MGVLRRLGSDDQPPSTTKRTNALLLCRPEWGPEGKRPTLANPVFGHPDLGQSNLGQSNLEQSNLGQSNLDQSIFGQSIFGQSIFMCCVVVGVGVGY